MTAGQLYAEDDLLPISALQHLLFCERQCALIHIEGVWAENRLTVEGRNLHERADHGPHETRRELRITRHLHIRSLRLGLTGRADVVEFHEREDAAGAPRIAPVEYKRGRPKRDASDMVQLCAQALCLEEMLGVPIPSGALFYATPRRRTEVLFDDELRRLTEHTALRLHTLIASGITPPAVREPKCDRCSLFDLCLPEAFSARGSASGYLSRALDRSLATPSDEP